MKSEIARRILDRIPEETRIFNRWYGDLIVLVGRIMNDQGLKQKDLAEMMDKRPSEISKWLKGQHNFTLRSLAKLQAELGETLIEVKIKEKSQGIKLKPVELTQKPVKVNFNDALKTSIAQSDSPFVYAIAS